MSVVDKDIEARILREMKKHTHVLCASAWLTSRAIIKQMNSMNSKVIIGEDLGTNYGKIKPLFYEKGKNMMHHKFMVFGNGGDWTSAITGSYNFTENAKSNHENIVMLGHEHARQYAEIFFDLWPTEPCEQWPIIKSCIERYRDSDARYYISGEPDWEGVPNEGELLLWIFPIDHSEFHLDGRACIPVPDQSYRWNIYLKSNYLAAAPMPQFKIPACRFFETWLDRSELDCVGFHLIRSHGEKCTSHAHGDCSLIAVKTESHLALFVREMLAPRDVASRGLAPSRMKQAYQSWCKVNGCTPKFIGIKDLKKALEAHQVHQDATLQTGSLRYSHMLSNHHDH